MGGLAAATLVVAACTGDDDEPDTDDEADSYVRSIADSIVDEEEEREGVVLDRDAATCLATAVVDVVGADALAAAGVTPEELADADSFDDVDVELPDDATAQLTEDIEDCDVAEPLRDVMVGELAAEADTALPPETAACLEDAIADRAAAEAIAATYVDGSQDHLASLFADAVETCPDALVALLIGQAAPGAVTPDEEDCLRAVVEDNTELVRSGIFEQDPGAADEFGAIVARTCPGAFG
jgi:hypothetical protein